MTQTEKMYMNAETGSVDNYKGWDYENENGETVNAVELGEVFEVVLNDDSEWVEGEFEEDKTMTKENLTKALVESKYYTEVAVKEIIESFDTNFVAEYELDEVENVISCIKDIYTECSKDEYEGYCEQAEEFGLESPEGLWLENGNFLAHSNN